MLVEIKPHFWVNSANKQEPYIFLEWLELVFNTGQVIFLQNNADHNRLELVDVNIDNEKKLVANRFNNTIKIVTETGSSNDFWKPLINQKITLIENPVLEEVHYEGGFMLMGNNYAFLLTPAEEEGISVERYLDDES